MLHNSSYWILNDQPLGKLMEYHSKQPLSHVWLKWQWQEREKKGAVGQNTEHTLSIEVAELQVPKSQLHLPLSSCVCTWLMRGKSNNNLKHYCPTEGFTEKDCLCRAETERLCSQPVNIPHSIFQYRWSMDPEQLLSNLHCALLARSTNNSVPCEKEKLETNNIKQGFLCC